MHFVLFVFLYIVLYEISLSQFLFHVKHLFSLLAIHFDLFLKIFALLILFHVKRLDPKKYF